MMVQRGIEVIGVVLASMVIAGCATTDGNPTAAESTATAAETTTTSAEAAPATPTGPPIGTATIAVRGSDAPVTITYSINGAPEQTERDVRLPWEKQYPVYDEIQTTVTADGGDTELMCTIIMDGKLLSFVTRVRPTCTFAYYG